MSSDERHNLSREDSLNTYFKDQGMKVLASMPNYKGLTSQEIVARSHFNQKNFSKTVTDNGGGYFYKHQNRPSGNMITNDSIILVHGPGTGKTFTQIKIVMDLMVSRIITSIVIINQSQNNNSVALRTFKTIFEDYYCSYFSDYSFEQFKRKFISPITVSKMATFNYLENSGVIIDEVHNLLTDNEFGASKGKAENFDELINKLSSVKGLKLVLCSATPLFGDKMSIAKYRRLMLRNRNETLNEIPETMISFIKVNYKHLNINMMMNGDYPGRGDLSFTMNNGKNCLFRTFVTKPSPMQIADFFNLEFNPDPEVRRIVKKDRFQTYDKPLIVNSLPRNGISQSAIIENIIKRTENSEEDDGTTIIYTDIKKKGTKEIERIFESRGIQKFSERSGEKAQSSICAHIDEIFIQELNEINRKIEAEEELYFGLSRKKLIEYKKDLELYLETGEDPKSFLLFVNEYEKSLIRDEECHQKIEKLKEQKKQIQEKISFQMKTGKKSASKKNYKYAIFTSEMTAEDKKIFEIFNSPKNWDGSLCKYLLISRVARDSVDMKNVTATDIVISDWRMAGNTQAEHRGIRNNSHEAIIRNRALKHKMELENAGYMITMDEAIDYIEKVKKVNAKIYYHLMDFDLIEEDDVKESMQYMEREGLEFFDNDPVKIMEHLKSDENEHKAGRKIYDAAISHHKEVGPAFNEMVSKAYDFRMNVQKEDRIQLASTAEEEEFFSRDMENEEHFGQGDTALFFIDDYVFDIVREIKEILIEKTWIYTDEIFEHFLEKSNNYTIVTINDAIVSLINSGMMYDPKKGTNAIAKLYIDKDQSILYIDSSKNNNSHPFISTVREIPLSFMSVLERQKTIIEKEDLEFPKNSEVLMKLKDLLERALMPNYILNINEITFLVQMSNFWSFSWSEMEEKRTYENINVYVFLTHITNPDINILAKDISVGEYNMITKKWKTLKTGSLKGMLFVRGASLINMYKNFDYGQIPELDEKFESRMEFNPSDYNGIVFIKGFYIPDPSINDKILRVLRPEGAIPEPILKNVVIKNFAEPTSKGCQISSFLKNVSSRENIYSHIKSTVEKGFSMLFFLYDTCNFRAGEKISIFDIKQKEKNIIDLAMSGNPPERFQICAVEKLKVSPERKKEIYRAIFRR